jgi:CMP-N-acetylneuraminic acid synthetase
MLAGVAYMMIRPSIPKEEVHKDFMALLNTSWAQAGTPLTERDIKNALAGYNPNNRQTVNSIISTLGFSPFKEPAKRNGRTQEEHLNMVARKKIEKSKKKITQILREQPDISISKAARLTGLSRPTVTKYWEECKRDMLL